MGEWQALIATCEQEIRSGRSREVAARLLPITRGSVPPEFLVVLAALCRRVGLIAHGLRFLSPAIVAHRNQQVAATGAQITEYAALLQRAGAQDEAVRWLGRPEVRDTPEALLILAFCRFAEWDYASAVPLLTQYLAQDLTPYARRVGEVNLVSALIAIGAASEADARLETLTQAARTERQWRLLVNCLEMRAQLDLAAGRFAVARAQLNAATELAATEQTLDQFLVAKWSAILDALELAKTEPLAHFRNEAAARGDWEGVREAVLYSLRAQMQDSLFTHLYFGTPFAGYRARIERELKRVPAVTTWHWGDGGPVLDTTDARAENFGLPVDVQAMQLVHVLASDLYRPFRLGQIFSRLFPGEYFNIESAPNRVRQAIHRARERLLAHGVPLVVSETDGGYALERSGPVRLALHLNRLRLDGRELQFAHLQREFGHAGGFTPGEGRAVLAISEATFRRLMAWAQERGQVDRVGATNSTYYRLR